MADTRYGYRHQKRREAERARVNAGEAHCWRCGVWLPPGCQFDLGHVDGGGPDDYMGAECIPCNRGTAAVRGNRARKNRSTTRSRWVL